MRHLLPNLFAGPAPGSDPVVRILQEAATDTVVVDGWLGTLYLSTPEFQRKIIFSLVTVVAIIVLRRLLLRVVDRRLEEQRSRYQWAKASSYVAFVLALLVIGQIWLEGIRQLGTFLGLLSAGLAIALRDLVANLAGWIFIVWRRPFVVGDRVQVAERAGDVVDIRIFQFTILEIGNWVDADQSTGRLIHIPNLVVFSEPLANYTSNFEYLWHEIPVLVTFESDWRRAKSILEEIVLEQVGSMSDEARIALRRVKHDLLISYRTVTPTVYTTVKDSGVLLTMRYLCLPRTRRGTTQAIWEAVLDAFAKEKGIDFAYPTRRVFHNMLEGRPEARAPLPHLSGLTLPPDRE